ncbi:hypothetical protein SBC2_77490 (plasmid) [Caballeronia sp. SBC2]|nr:hypothetical protein SBC2_77490 [Caballeronia sp. SBC2]
MRRPKTTSENFVEKYYDYQSLHSATNNLPQVLYEASFL